MSNFLGNHDVERFINHAAGEVSSIYGEGLAVVEISEWTPKIQTGMSLTTN